MGMTSAGTLRQGYGWCLRFPNAFLPSQESILKGRFAPSGRIEGFTAEIGASGSYCPQHVTLPVDVTYFDISEHSVPSPFLVHGCGRAVGGCALASWRSHSLWRVPQAITCLWRWLPVPGAAFNLKKEKGKEEGSYTGPCCFVVVIVITSLVTASLFLLLTWRGAELRVFLLTCAKCSQ